MSDQKAKKTGPRSAPKIVLAFMAHPDDAEFLCAGTLARLVEQGWQAHIASVAAGDCGTMTQDRWQIMARRTVEARTAAGLIGAQFHCLDDRDGMVVYDKPTLQMTIDLFRRISPSLVFTHAPHDYMPDHDMVSLLARGASFLFAGSPNISTFPRVPGSSIPHLYYCDPLEGIDYLGHPVTPTATVDISAAMPRKVQMLCCHASQREWLQEHHGIDEYVEAMKRHARMRGAQAGSEYAEGFVQHRGHAYPREDLLCTLLGASSERQHRE